MLFFPPEEGEELRNPGIEVPWETWGGGKRRETGIRTAVSEVLEQTVKER